MQLDTDKILAEKGDGVGWLIINNPDRRNAISLDMWQAMAQVFDEYAGDPDVRCVVMKGAGDKAFASGADISQFEKVRANAEAAAEYNRISKSTRRSMISFDKPVIAMIRGFCMGGGLGIALTTDLRIAADDSTFGIPAARLGIAYDFTSLNNLVQLVGPGKAREILLTARRFNAQEALAMGLVNSVVPVAALDNAVREVTGHIVENAPLSLRASKMTIAEVLKDAEQRDLELIAKLERDCFDSNDYKEGRSAFMEKRKPAFSGT
jgi:enoyl-CoA hydratase/carnithine racemase